MVVWLRPECILAIVTSLYYCSLFVSSKTYDKFWCSTEEGQHQLSCPDETALLTDVSIRKVYRRTQMCEPDVHSDYLVFCQTLIDGSFCEGNRTCSIEVSSRDYLQCGDKIYSPTYFYVKYTCTQIHIMCKDTAPIRNTLYGFIVSPAYPHPMADNLKCSINIEADPSMFIEIAPIQIRLQDAIKCRSEYLDIFGYLNPNQNDSSRQLSSSSINDGISDKNGKTIWKSYHTWCGTHGSTNNPPHNTRYLISSNSLYMSLQTAVSKKPRYFKIRYKVVPSTAQARYDSDGIAVDSIAGVQIPPIMMALSSTPILSTTIVLPSVQDMDLAKQNGTVTKPFFKKKILIGAIAGVIVLVVAILIGVGILLYFKRRRPSPPSKASASSSSTAVGKKPVVASASSTTSPAVKTATKSTDKASLLEPTTSANTNAAGPIKRKLVPERTVQISDLNSSRFKAATTSSTPGQLGAAKDSSSTSSEAVATSSAPTTLKPPMTPADSGIYGADLSDDMSPKPTTPVVPTIYGIDLPDKSEATTTPSAITIVINPISQTTTIPDNSTISAIVVPNNLPLNPLPLLSDEIAEKEHLLAKIVDEQPSEQIDTTVQSAYPNLIDATTSENEATGGSIAGSASQSRRTSNVNITKQPLLSYETNNLQSVDASIQMPPRKTTQFNPLHVIFKKDANKYYTTEYI